MTEPGTFVCCVVVEKNAVEWEYVNSPQHWEFLKKELIHKFYHEHFLKFLDGGWWTFNLLFVQEDVERNGPNTKLGVVGKIFKVTERTQIINTVSWDYQLPVLKKEWKILCAGCGNIFVPDRRGGCSACGSPADWIKNWTLEAK